MGTAAGASAMAGVMVAGLILCGVASADTVELVTGEKIDGAIIESNDDVVVMEHAVLGRLEIAADQVKPPDEEKINPGLFGTSFLEGWTRGASLGWSAASGKSSSQNLNADLGLNRETDDFRGKFLAKYFYSESDREVEDDQFKARYTHDFLFGKKRPFPFLSPHYTYDSRQDWNHRAGIDAGVGYQFVKNDQWDVIGRLGGGISQTLKDDRDRAGPPGMRDYVGDDPIRTEPTGLVMLTGAWTYMEGQSLSAGARYEPDFADLPNFRAVGNAEWKIAVGVIEGLGFKIGIDYIHDAHETNKNRNDRKYYANLAYDF